MSCSVQSDKPLCGLHKTSKGIERDKCPSQSLPPPYAESTKSPLHEHTETREAEFILLCFSSVIYTFVVAVKSDSVTYCITYL